MEKTTTTTKHQSTAMASPPSSRAAKKVFAIPELLEMILLETDELTLFTLQSVNKTFKSVIADSKAVRRRMCLEPTRDSERLGKLLDRVYEAGVTFPYRVGLLRQHAAPDWFDITIPCKWLKPYARRDPDQVYMGLIKSMRSGSWRQIKIADPDGEGAFVDLHCINYSFELASMDVGEVEAEDTLGILVDGVTEVMKKHLGGEIQCSQYNCC